MKQLRPIMLFENDVEKNDVALKMNSNLRLKNERKHLVILTARLCGKRNYSTAYYRVITFSAQ